MNRTLFGSGIQMVGFSNGWFYSYKLVKTIPENQMAIQYLVR
jgi:hypothetical protein